MPKQSADIEEFIRRIEENIQTDLKTSPEEIRHFGISNLLKPVLSYLVGKVKEGEYRQVEVTSGGELKTVGVGAGYDEYDVESGSGANTYIAANTYEFSDAYSTTDLLIESADAEVSFQDETGAWGGDIPLPTGYHSIDYTAYGVRIRNRVSGSTTDYTISLWR